MQRFQLLSIPSLDEYAAHANPHWEESMHWLQLLMNSQVLEKRCTDCSCSWLVKPIVYIKQWYLSHIQPATSCAQYNLHQNNKKVFVIIQKNTHALIYTQSKMLEQLQHGQKIFSDFEHTDVIFISNTKTPTAQVMHCLCMHWIFLSDCSRIENMAKNDLPTQQNSIIEPNFMPEEWIIAQIEFPNSLFLCEW